VTVEEKLLLVAERGAEPTGFARTWVVGYDGCGDLCVRSLLRPRRHGEPWWTRRFRAGNPWHRLCAWWTFRKGGVAWVEPT
jgi:hypothetical protein